MNWFHRTCAECRIKDVRIESLSEEKLNLKGLLQESRDREKVAIDQLLQFQGKPPVSTQRFTDDQANQFMNPFADVGKGEKIMPGIFDDVLKRESG
jgi:hypothetical protein